MSLVIILEKQKNNWCRKNMRKQLLHSLRWRRERWWQSPCLKPLCSINLANSKHNLHHGLFFLPETSKFCLQDTYTYDVWNTHRSGNQSPSTRNINDQLPEPPQSRISLLARPFGLGWRDKNKVSLLLTPQHCLSRLNRLNDIHHHNHIRSIIKLPAIAEHNTWENCGAC